jgi:hypothetical protein
MTKQADIEIIQKKTRSAKRDDQEEMTRGRDRVDRSRE